MNASEFAIEMIKKSVEAAEKGIAQIHVNFSSFPDIGNATCAVGVQIYLGGLECASERNKDKDYQWDYYLNDFGSVQYEKEMQAIEDLLNRFEDKNV